MTNAQFTRRIEKLTCDFCGTEVHGNGYTNHCPECLVSKHVDVNPGDRASGCHGLMMPIAIERKNGKEYIVQCCEKCGFERRNKVCPEDNRDSVIAVMHCQGNINLYQQMLNKRLKTR